MPTLEVALADAQAKLAGDRTTQALLLDAIAESQAKLNTAQFAATQLAQDIIDIQAEIQTLTDELEAANQMRAPTTSFPYSIRKDDTGIRPWALQRGLNGVGWDLLEDAVFGDETEFAVKAWQGNHDLVADGLFGAVSSAALAKQFDNMQTGLPVGLVRGQMETESGNWIAAVNWSVPGGVDCGYTQRRVYASDFENQDVLRRAFDSSYQIGLLATRLKERKAVYRVRAAVQTDEFAWRLASLYHNYPTAADTISKVGYGGLSSYWTTPQTWVQNIGAKWPDGLLVDTPLGWSKYYALGAPGRNWPGATTKYVNDWTIQ